MKHYTITEFETFSVLPTDGKANFSMIGTITHVTESLDTHWMRFIEAIENHFDEAVEVIGGMPDLSEGFAYFKVRTGNAEYEIRIHETWIF